MATTDGMVPPMIMSNMARFTATVNNALESYVTTTPNPDILKWIVGIPCTVTPTQIMPTTARINLMRETLESKTDLSVELLTLTATLIMHLEIEGFPYLEVLDTLDKANTSLCISEELNCKSTLSEINLDTAYKPGELKKRLLADGWLFPYYLFSLVPIRLIVERNTEIRARSAGANNGQTR